MKSAVMRLAALQSHCYLNVAKYTFMYLTFLSPIHILKFGSYIMCSQQTVKINLDNIEIHRLVPFLL